ncbi:MAG: hypothetical protein D6675_13320 [Gemmatimonadetes bacterium]|nr:MAG: hypothetical protein D6675_13320 [Gemmatimonadota bacterium]
MRITIIGLMLLMFTSPLVANDWDTAEKERLPEETPREFQFLAYFITKGVADNISSTTDVFKGQTVGRLFGGNYTSTNGPATSYFEQRLLPFLIYQPKIFNGKALLRASFEVDWTWGDQNYGAGGNFGGGFGGDQTNIQTQNIEVELIPRPGWAINLGLQRLYDTPYNPYRTFFSTMTYTGYRLHFWGSDAVGISVRHDQDFARLKLGYYQLYENNIQERDDVALWEAMYERDLTKTWRQGVSFWYVHDRSNGEGGVSIFNQGLTSALTAYNGVFRFPLGSDPYRADIFWLGTFFNQNPEFTLGRFALNGYAIANLGYVQQHDEDGWRTSTDIFGMAANLRAGYKYGQTAKDAVTLDILFTSGDDDALDDDLYSGVITGNTWTSPGALVISSGAYLLFPHGNVVNRYVSAVSDLSNLGYGLIAGTLNFSKDIIPNKFSAKAGTALALSTVEPENGGRLIGLEVNGSVGYQFKIFMDWELYGAYLALGDFYDSALTNGNQTEKPDNAWALFSVFKWLMF